MNAPQEPPPPRVLHLDDGRLWRGGQHQVWLLLRGLAGLGVAQRLVAREGCPLTVRARGLGIDVATLNYRGEFDFKSPGRIAAIARGFGANLIHAHTAHAHAAGLAAVRRLRGQARLVTTRRVDFPVGKGWFSRRKYRAAGQHFIAISNKVRDVLIEGGVDPARIDIVASGVPPIDPAEAQSRRDARRAFGIPDGQLAILNVGALTDHKGQRWLIDAAPRVLEAFPEARFHLLGDGELRGALERQIAQLGLQEKLVLHGFVDDARLRLAAFDLYVSSSHLEGLGTANLDAVLAGLPIVAAAAGGVTDIVIDGETGRLVPPRDAAALAAAIVAALSAPEESRAMSERALERVQTHFSAESMTAGALAVYRKLLSE